MAEDGKDEDKLKFTPEGEAVGYISLDQARVLALQHARDNHEVYGRYADVELVWDELNAEESEDYYRVRLSFRPARGFRGRPGVEQFTIDKTGPIELRQVVSEPRTFDTRNVALMVLVAVVAVGATVGGLFASGALTSSSSRMLGSATNSGTSGVVATAPVIVPIVPDSAVRLVSPEGDVTIDLGVGAVSAASQLVYQSASGEIPSLSGPYRATGKVFDLSTDAPLLQPVTITVRISAAEVVLAGSREENIVIQHYRDGAWTLLETEVDLGRSTAMAQVDSLSIFALTVKEPEPTATPSAATAPVAVPTIESTVIPVATGTVTSVPTHTPPSTATPASGLANTPIGAPTETPVPTLVPAPTATPVSTPTPAPTATKTAIPTPTLVAPVLGNLLETTVVPEGLGSISVNPPNQYQSYATGTLVRITVTCEYGFDGWTGEVPGQANASSRSIVVAMDQPRSIIANCAAGPPEASSYTLKINGQTPNRGELMLYVLNGTVHLTRPPDEGGKFKAGTSLLLMASPTQSHFQVIWSGVDSTDGNFATVIMDGEKDVNVSIVQPVFTLTGNPNPINGGTVVGGGQYFSGTQATLLATPKSGWTFNGWAGDCSGGGGCLVIMDSDKSVIGNFLAVGTTPAPTSTAPTPVPTPTPVPSATAIPTPTPTPGPSPTPLPTATPTPTPPPGSTATPTPTPTPTSTPTPTPTPVPGGWRWHFH